MCKEKERKGEKREEKGGGLWCVHSDRSFKHFNFQAPKSLLMLFHPCGHVLEKF